MYIYLEENRNAYHKGQLTPFFIAILTILIIAIFVVINIGKIGMDRTYVSNTVDAGALAGASVMAGLYTSLAETKESMIKSWETWLSFSYLSSMAQLWSYFMTIKKLIKEAQEQGRFAIIFMGYGIIAAMQCMSLNCEKCPWQLTMVYGIGMTGAMTFLGWGRSNLAYAQEYAEGMPEFIDSLKTALHEWWDAMHENYQTLKASVKETWEAAIEYSYKLAWINSGISSKMTDEQSDEFSDWISEDPEEGWPSFVTDPTYDWQDPSARDHTAHVHVEIDEPTTYIWKVTDLNKPELDMLWDHSRAEAVDLIGNISDAKNDYYNAILGLMTSMIAGIIGWATCNCCDDCSSWVQVVFCIIFYAAEILYVLGIGVAIEEVVHALVSPIPDALDNIDEIEDDLDEIANGMALNRTVTNPAVYGDEVLCWLDAMPHDHRVFVSTWQEHEGKDYSLWDVDYPKLEASAMAEFGGATSGLSDLDWTANILETN